ncbi:hypothetical protein EDC04DRAFT_2674636 [Pisolithus marmoratus]|nr:hypothetical protein EDC04DRAFT_2674636 [Pisolithus marmoratus]
MGQSSMLHLRGNKGQRVYFLSNTILAVVLWHGFPLRDLGLEYALLVVYTHVAPMDVFSNLVSMRS